MAWTEHRVVLQGDIALHSIGADPVILRMKKCPLSVALRIDLNQGRYEIGLVDRLPANGSLGFAGGSLRKLRRRCRTLSRCVKAKEPAADEELLLVVDHRASNSNEGTVRAVKVRQHPAVIALLQNSANFDMAA